MIRTVIFLILFLPAILNAAERIVQQSIPVNQDVKLSISNQRGGIEIRTGSTDSIELTAYIEHDDIEALGDVDVAVNSNSSAVDIDVLYNSTFRLSLGFIGLNDVENPSVRLVVTVPDQASLSLTGHRTVFDIQAPAGRVEIFSQRGNGQIVDVRGDFEIDINRGDFSIYVQQLHDIDISAQRGDILLNIHDAENYRLLGKFRSGSFITTNENISITKLNEDYLSIDHTDGDGSTIINLDTRRVNLRLDFQD